MIANIAGIALPHVRAMSVFMKRSGHMGWSLIPDA